METFPKDDKFMITVNSYKIENELLANLKHNNIINQLVTYPQTSANPTDIYQYCYTLSNLRYQKISDFLLQVFVSSFYFSYSINNNIWLKDYNYNKFMNEYQYLIERIMAYPARNNMQAHEIYAFIHQITSDIFEGVNIGDISNLNEILTIYHRLGESLYYTWHNKLSTNLKDANLIDRYFFMAINGLA